MGRRKTKIEEPVEDINHLVEGLETAEEKLKNINIESDGKKEEDKKEEDKKKEDKKEDDVSNDLDSMRSELIKLAEDGQLDQSVKYIKKTSSKVIKKIYQEYEQKRLQKANEFLTDLLISKFSRILGGLYATDWVKKMEDQLLKRDANNTIGCISPHIPYLGLFSGGLTVGKHISNHMLGH